MTQDGQQKLSTFPQYHFSPVVRTFVLEKASEQSLIDICDESIKKIKE